MDWFAPFSPAEGRRPPGSGRTAPLDDLGIDRARLARSMANSPSVIPPPSPSDIPSWWDYMAAKYDDPDFVFGSSVWDLSPGPNAAPLDERDLYSDAAGSEPPPSPSDSIVSIISSASCTARRRSKLPWASLPSG